MKWFGDSWGAPVCNPEEHRPVPAGIPCGFCTEPLRETDRGLTMPYLSPDGDTEMSVHLACFKKSVGIT